MSLLCSFLWLGILAVSAQLVEGVNLAVDGCLILCLA